MKDALGHGSDERGGGKDKSPKFEMRRAIDGVMRPYYQLRTASWDRRVAAAKAFLRERQANKHYQSDHPKSAGTK